MKNKKLQRETVRNLRLGIKKEFYQAYSDSICKKAMETDEYKNAKTVMIYCPINREVDTSLLLDNCTKHKILVLPKTDTETMQITPCIVKKLSELKEGAFGILEPNENCTKIDIADIDVVFLPLVAFDKKGSRLGYGGGYYDRLLTRKNNCTKIGLAFSIQEVEFIEHEKFDINLDMAVTEKEKIVFKRI